MDNVFSGEFFEVNFFFKVEEKDQIIKKVTSLLRVKEGENFIDLSDIPLLRKRAVLLTIYEYENECDYFDFCLNIPNFVITNQNFFEILLMLTDIVNRVYKFVNSESLVTCVYEMTGYYIDEVKYFSDFSDKVLSKFPIVFYRRKNIDNVDITFSFDAISCKVNCLRFMFQRNINVQDIFDE